MQEYAHNCYRRMDLRKIKLVILAAAFCAAVLSCKKDDKDTILPSLDGDIAFKYPEFVKTLETITFKPEGVSHPEGKGYGYYWKEIVCKSNARRGRGHDLRLSRRHGYGSVR